MFPAEILPALTIALVAVAVLAVAILAFAAGLAFGIWIADPRPAAERDPPIPENDAVDEELPPHVNDFFRLSVLNPKPKPTP